MMVVVGAVVSSVFGGHLNGLVEQVQRMGDLTAQLDINNVVLIQFRP